MDKNRIYGTKQGLPFAVVVVVAAVVDEGPWPEIKFWMIIRKMASKKLPYSRK